MSNFSLTSEPAHPARQHVDSLDRLQKDMLDALDADQVKKQINDAKLRGVKQRVEYDEFEKLVMGAHLRPIKAKTQALADIGKQFDGFVMPKHEPKPAGPAPRPLAALPPATEAVPVLAKTSNEFTRVWRRQLKTPAVRRAYIRQLEPETLPLIFRTELDPGLFDGIVATLGESCLQSTSETGAPAAAAAGAPASDDLAEIDVSDGETPTRDEGAAAELLWAAAMLRGISRLNRFEITLDFADKATLATLAQLLSAMPGAGVDADTVATLRSVYKSA